jgi:hypothetical protein
MDQEKTLELSARKIIIRCINRMNVIPELFDFEQFWNDYGFNVMNMIEDKTPNSEIHEEIGDLLKPFAR